MDRKQAFEQGATQISLDNFVSQRVLTSSGWEDLSDVLTDEDIAKILRIITKRCSPEIKDRLECRLQNVTSLYGTSVFSRLTLDRSGVWEYTAGQSCPEEIARLRKAILR